MIVARFNSANLLGKMNRMERYAGAPALRTASFVLIGAIKKNSLAGLDANNKPFPWWTPIGKRTGPGPYSPEQAARRKKKGKQTGKKTLNVDGDMLASLGLQKNRVTVSPMEMQKAVGQMYHPNWRYHHEFLLASENVVREIEQRHARDLESA